MASIQLRPCSNQFESEADYIEIPINDTNYLRIRKEYGHILSLLLTITTPRGIVYNLIVW